MSHLPILFFACACLLAVAVKAEPEVVPLWPEGKIPLLKDAEKPEKVLPSKDTIVRITDVSNPTLTVFRAAAGAKAAPAVVVCPGGGYGILAFNHEGTEIAEWFNRQGVTAFVLKYRVPGQPDAAFCDAQRALGLVRSNAAKYNVNPRKIGIIGFSAGANLSVRVSTNYGKRAYEAVDAADAVSCRPDFSMIIYPWHLIAKQDQKGFKLTTQLAREYPVDRETPPAFLIQAEDDGCLVENSLAYYHALKLAKVPAEMHLFAKGGHGYGMRVMQNPTDVWPSLAATWLKNTVGKDE